MNPITMMRNALGREEGGSGVPVDRGEYGRAVEFWERYALIRSTKKEEAEEDET